MCFIIELIIVVLRGLPKWITLFGENRKRETVSETSSTGSKSNIDAKALQKPQETLYRSRYTPERADCYPFSRHQSQLPCQLVRVKIERLQLSAPWGQSGPALTLGALGPALSDSDCRKEANAFVESERSNKRLTGRLRLFVEQRSSHSRYPRIRSSPSDVDKMDGKVSASHLRNSEYD